MIVFILLIFVIYFCLASRYKPNKLTILKIYIKYYKTPYLTE